MKVSSDLLEGSARPSSTPPTGQAARLEDLLLRITRSRARAAVLQGPAPQHQQRVPSIVELRLQVRLV